MQHGDAWMKNRWEYAQRAESKFWRRHKDRVYHEHIAYMRRMADHIRESILCRLGQQRPLSVLQIGPAAVGEIDFLDIGFQCAVDPLSNDYARMFPDLRLSLAPRVTGVGEALPFASRSFDLVIIDNVIDHVQAPEFVLGESHRVLCDRGALYLRVHTYSGVGYLIRVVSESFYRLIRIPLVDPGHPHTFTPERIKTLLDSSRFEVRWHAHQSAEEKRRRHRQSTDLRVKLLRGYGPFLDVIHEFLCFKAR